MEQNPSIIVEQAYQIGLDEGRGLGIRELIIKKIGQKGWMDCHYNFKYPDRIETYEEYLLELNDDDLLDTYVNIKEIESRIMKRRTRLSKKTK